jgi:nucleotide-binding universal stress UspA family protein
VDTLPVRPSTAALGDAGGLREILFACDLSPASDLAFDHARLLAQRSGAQLTLYHVVEAPPAGSHGAREGRDRWERARRAATAYLEMRAAALDVPWEILVEPAARPAERLLQRLTDHPPDLTVMATHGRGGMAHLVLGSVTEAVLARRLSPVLCIRPAAHGAALPYRRILLPTDLSHESRDAFRMAALLARAFDAEVVGLHVVRVPQPASLAHVPELVESKVPDERALRAFFGPELSGLRLTTRVAAGEPWQGILQAARAERADVIVMSTHGHDSVFDRVIGGHADHVVRQAPCPVLVA